MAVGRVDLEAVKPDASPRPRRFRRILQIRGHLVYFWAGSDPVILDLGAHLGEFSRQALQVFGGEAIAVEANPDLAARIPPQADLRVLAVAVAAETGTVSLSVGDNPEASSTLFSPSGVLNDLTVPAMGIRQLVKDEAEDSVAVLKLDVEGAEIPVLAAMSDQEIQRITQVTVEFHDELGFGLPEDVEAVSARMRRLGYAEFRSSRTHPTTDVLFVSRRLTGLGSAEELWLRRVIIPAMGIKRVLKRLARGAAPGRWRLLLPQQRAR